MTSPTVSNEFLELIDRLEEITIRMHEALAFEKYTDLPLLARQRQDLITALEEFDTISRASNNSSSWSCEHGFRRKLDKIMVVGDALLDACMERLDMLVKLMRQRSVIRATVRGYRPRSPDRVTTRNIKS